MNRRLGAEGDLTNSIVRDFGRRDIVHGVFPGDCRGRVSLLGNGEATRTRSPAPADLVSMPARLALQCCRKIGSLAIGDVAARDLDWYCRLLCRCQSVEEH